jgi:hypothetical protein
VVKGLEQAKAAQGGVVFIDEAYQLLSSQVTTGPKAVEAGEQGPVGDRRLPSQVRSNVFKGGRAR